MRKIINLTLAAALVLAATGSVLAAELTKGKVKTLDEAAGEVTITHEALKGLDMPAMTMTFRIGKGVDAAKLTAGSDIEFAADRVDGMLTVIEVK